MYASNPEVCGRCEFLSQCTSSANHRKLITRHVWENIEIKRGKVERSFADSKQLHGHRYVRFRGLQKIRGALASNIKKIALALSRKVKNPKASSHGGMCAATDLLIDLILTCLSSKLAKDHFQASMEQKIPLPCKKQGWCQYSEAPRGIFFTEKNQDSISRPRAAAFSTASTTRPVKPPLSRVFMPAIVSPPGEQTPSRKSMKDFFS